VFRRFHLSSLWVTIYFARERLRVRIRGMVLLFSPDPSHADIKDFMDDAERAYWDTQKGTPEERTEVWKSLKDLWRSIPDPTEAQLRQLNEYDWGHIERGENRDQLLTFYRRKWKKDRKPDAVARRAEEATQPVQRIDDAQPPDPSEPKSTGIYAPGERRAKTAQEEYVEELRRFMPQPLREEYDKASGVRRDMLWAANERAFKEAEKRQQQKLLAEEELTAKALDMLQRVREDPNKAHLLPPDGASMADLHKWYGEMSKPDRKGLPFPTEGGGRPDYGNPRDSELRLNFVRDSKTREVGPRATPGARRDPPQESQDPDAQLSQPKKAFWEDPELAATLAGTARPDLPRASELPNPTGSHDQGLFDKTAETFVAKSFGEKFTSFTESNLFWGGGVGLALAASAFKWANAPPKLTITMLVIAWLIISISVYRHGFFDRWSRTVEAIGNLIVFLLIAVVFVAVWVVLEPATNTVQSAAELTSPSPVNSLRSAPTVSPVSTPSGSITPSPKTALGTPSIDPIFTRPLPGSAPTSDATTPISFDRIVLIKGGPVHRLDNVMIGAGYKGPLLFQTLYIHNRDVTDNGICWGDQSDIDVSSGNCLPPNDGYNFPGGRDAKQVYLVSKKDVRLYISALSK
jgi:hypothetical protein